jgi:hypothetical protein
MKVIFLDFHFNSKSYIERLDILFNIMTNH